MNSKQLFLSILFVLNGSLSYGQYFVYRDSTGKSNIEDVLKNPGYFAERENLDFGVDNVWFWIKIPLENKQNKPNTKYIVLENPYLDLVHGYQTSNQKVSKDFGPKSYKTPFENRFLKHHSFVFPIEFIPKESTFFYLKVHRHLLLVQAPLKFFTTEEFYEYDTQRRLIFNVFSGVFLTLIIFSIVLFVINQEYHFLYYAAFLLCLLISILLIEGYLINYFQKINALFSIYHWRNAINSFSALFLGLFIKSFILKGAENDRFIQKIFLTTILSSCISLFFLALEKPINEHYNQPIHILTWLPFVFLILAILLNVFMVFYSLKKRIQPYIAKIFLIGILPITLFTLLSFFRNGGILQYSPWLSYYMRLGFLLFDSMILFVGISLQIKFLREEKDMYLERALQNQLKLLHEKERISRDLHDSVGSHLTIISTNLDNAFYQAEMNFLKPEKIYQINESVRDAVQSLRDSIWATHQSEINIENFTQRLKTYCSKLSYSNLEISINFTDDNLKINSLTALCLFRILQECIQNTLKHTIATQITITGNFENKIGTLSYTDNGIGFEIDKIEIKEHFGIENIKKRIEEIEGSFQIISNKNNGTSILLRFPV